MKTIYRAGSITEAHIVAGMLEAQGIDNHVGGHYLQGAVGEVAPLDFARVLVADEDYEAALPLIAAYENSQPSYTEEQDKPSNSNGLFSKKALFWGVIALLAWWFLF